MATKLSLTTRKNIKEAEPKLQEKLKKISAASGVDFEVEIDWTQCIETIEARGYKDRAGEVIYEWYVGGLSENVEKFCKDPIQKESFVETFGSRKTIGFAFHAENPEEYRSEYNWITNNDGVLTINIPAARMCTNCSNTGNNLAAACSGDGPLTVLTRKNIKDQDVARVKHLKTISGATGIEFDTEFDWVTIAQAVGEKGYKDRVGEVIYDWYLKGLAEQIVKYVKDPIQKESFVESFGERRMITMALHATAPEDHTSDYVWTSNNDGVLTINVPLNRMCTNCGNTGNDLAKACSGDGPLTVLTRKNIADTQAKLKTHLKTILDASGLDFELEIDWAVIAAAAKEKGYGDRAGEVVHDWYIKGLADNVKKYCQDDIQKESFVETFGSRKTITLTVLPEAPEGHSSDYVWVENQSGVLAIVSTKARFCTNCGNTGNNLSKACSGDGPLTVATRKNIKDTLPKLQTHLKAIEKESGVLFDVEIDWVPFAKAVGDKGYADRAGEVLHEWYIKGLAENIKKFCKDPIQKESFVETFGTRKTIGFAIHEKNPDDHASDYMWTTNADGVLLINTSLTRICTNCGNTGMDLSKACSGDGPLSVATRKNIADKMADRNKILARIQKATGVEYEVELDWALFAQTAAAKGYADRIGEVINWYLNGLADNIEKLCKDDMCKEALVEATAKKTITFQLVAQSELGSAYQTVTFSDDGTLVISTSTERVCTNCGNTGNDIMSRL